MKLRLCSVGLLWLSLLSTPLLAAPNSQALLDQLYELEVETYRSSTLFHMFTFLEGDKKVAKKLESSLDRIQALIPGSDLIDGDRNLQSLVARIQEAYDIYRKAALANEIADQGYTSVYAVSDLDAAESDVVKAAQAPRDYLLGNQRPLRYRVMLNAVLVQKMASRYSRLAAHWNGRTGLMADDEGDTIDVNAIAFEEQLMRLKEHITDDRLREVTMKWAYISTKMINYQQETVPYLISRYSDSIVSGLMSVASDTAVSSEILASN